MPRRTSNKNEIIEKLFIQSGLRITPQRVTIYKILMNLRTHPSVDEVYTQVRKSLPRISFDTVYRTICSFVDKGIVRIAESSSGVKRYDPCTHEHHHLHCIKCEKIIDFTNNEYNKISLPKLFPGEFKPLYKRMVIEGICKECSNK